MRKITVLVGHEGITITGDISEMSSQLIGSGWLNHRGGYYKEKATMTEVKSIINMYGEPYSASERFERNVLFRTDSKGHVVIEGETIPIKDRLKAKGGLWSPRSRQWSFQGMSLDTVKSFVDDMTKDGSCDTKIIELVWDTPVSPTQLGEKPIPRAAASFAALPQAGARRFNGEIPREVVEKAVVRDGSGKIISISGFPVPGVTGPETAETKCDLCGFRGHTRMDCICPFCRHIDLHNPMACPSKDVAFR